METEEGLSFYSCSKCRVYFEAYSQAFTHLKVKHDLKVETLESTSFPKCYISLEERAKNNDKNISSSSSSSVVSPLANNNSSGLERDKGADETDDKTITENNEPSLKRTRTRAPKKKNPGRIIPSSRTDADDDNGGRVEIKLDNLKASEIEALMQDLFEPKGGGGGGTRNSSRRTRKPKYNPAIYSVEALSDSDSDYKDNEEVRKSSSSSEDGEDIGSDSDTPHPKTSQGGGGRKSKIRILRHKCPKCGKPFESPAEVRRHLRTHEPHKKPKGAGPKKAYPCPLCDRSYDIVTSLRDHFIIHLENNPFVCKMSSCNGARFQNRKSLKRHMELHLGEKRYKCDKCDYSYVRRYSLLKHLKKCGKTIMPPKQLHIVKRVETETEIDEITTTTPESVKQNGSVDNTISSNSNDYQNLKINMKKEDEEEDEFLKIEVGSQHFDDTPIADLSSSDNEEEEQDQEDPQTQDPKPSQTFNTHSLRDITLKDPVYLKLLSENPKMAALVLPRYDKSGSLEITKRKIFQCPLCSWKGGMIQNFRAHFRIVHNQEVEDNPEARHLANEVSSSVLIPTSNKAPGSGVGVPSSSLSVVTLFCGKCGYPSTSSDDLAEHMNKEHPETAKHRCSRCTLTFTTLKALKEHEQRVHFSEKKYQCSQCPAKYSLLTSLKSHVEMKHKHTKAGKENFPCHNCKIPFATKALLHAHQREKHKVNPVQCKLCGASSYNKYSLERHIRIVHVGIKAKQYPKKKDQESSSVPVPVPSSATSQQNEKTNDNDQEILGF